jgi:hypothetical protein
MNSSSPSDISDGITATKKVLPSSSTTEKEKIIANATLATFIVMNDGKNYFVIDGNEWPARDIRVEVLRKFASKNDNKRSQPPYHSLSRNSKKKDIIEEIVLKRFTVERMVKQIHGYRRTQLLLPKRS